MLMPVLGHLSERDVVDQMTRVDNEVALAWLGNSLEYARSRGQTRLAMLLTSVRTEIMFETKLVKTGKSAPLASFESGTR